jgi:hypothetical protein
MITVICPSRGRPDNAIRLVKSFSSTRRYPDTQLVIAIDGSDPEFQNYCVVDWDDWVENENVNLFVASPERLRMVATLNKTAKKAVKSSRCDVVGFVGDDHLFETDGWDTKMIEAMVPNGIVYGDDGHQHSNLPTAVFMDANIVRKLGWMAPPQFTHLWIDNVWKALGEKLGTLRYLPEMKITHLHPHAGKAEWDATYAEANDPEVETLDRYRFNTWVGNGGLEIAAMALQRKVEL